jgi:hypothetical protein
VGLVEMSEIGKYGGGFQNLVTRCWQFLGTLSTPQIPIKPNAITIINLIMTTPIIIKIIPKNINKFIDILTYIPTIKNAKII